MLNQNNDIDQLETKEWLESFEDVIQREGKDRALFIFNQLAQYTEKLGIESNYSKCTMSNFSNTIAQSSEPQYAGNLVIEKKIEAYHRWNATVMVAKANKKDSSLGGHIGTGGGALTLYEVGFNHFFKAPNQAKAGDLIFYQGHASPIIYARSYLEGRYEDEHLNNFRQQAFNDKALSSYPHPYLQPTYWQFPTVSMGLGPLQAIYQARFMRYLENRNITSTSGRKVWAFCGDGEMDEPESLGAITRAAREGLDNLIFVINCNLQRLDGLVDGNGKIVQELAHVFEGAGWNVIKVIWGSNWNKLFAKDVNNKLQKRLAELNDGQLHTARAHGGSSIRETIFGGDPELEAMVADMSDEDLEGLQRGGHDPIKVYAAYHQAVNNNNGKPTLILPMTVKGYGLGEFGESKNIAHNVKKLNIDGLKQIRDTFDIPVTDEQVENYEFIRLPEDSVEYKYLHDKRNALGGYMPSRFENRQPLAIPAYTDFAKALLKNSANREFSTTTAFVRVLTALCKDKNIKKNIVPVTVDESRTFGMEGLFRQLGIYNHLGQNYIPEDKNQVMYYKESKDGQNYTRRN